MERQIDKGTPISISLVLTIIIAAISWGIIYQKVETLRGNVAEVKIQIAALNDKFDVLIAQKIANK